MKKVLVTGAAGYIGSVLTRELLNRGYFVRGMDKLNFGGESLLGIYHHHNFEFFNGDIRKEAHLNSAIENIDAVIHLAAIVGDPACAAVPGIAEETNWTASKLLLDLCSEKKGINNFIFSSTCSNYGKMDGDKYIDEYSSLRPVSLYAKLKVRFEEYLLNQKLKNNMAVTALRFSTVYGLSPRLRFDLTVNEFIRQVTMGKELIIYGEQFWRPYCHVIDLAKSCILVLESDKEKVSNNVYGVGSTKENYTKKMIVSEILKLVPLAKIKYVQKDEDPRNYRVDFSKIYNDLGFEITKKVPDGLKEIHTILIENFLSDPFDKKYNNLNIEK
jgi:nucleoside-diphosphate-sugar epimerase